MYEIKEVLDDLDDGKYKRIQVKSNSLEENKEESLESAAAIKKKKFES